MQHFYANIPPCGRARSSIGRCATKRTGMSISLGSLQGVLSIDIHYDEKTGKDMYRIELRGHGGKRGAIAGQLRKVIAEGELSEKMD